jgi:phosphoribosyl 1,2-cyclic phosphodiesterase
MHTMDDKHQQKDIIKFLGTAGARFVVTRQLRKSGGIWLTMDNTSVLIDPGPGSLVNCHTSRPQLNPRNLDGIILTHRHIDHSNDANIMIEAMTNGGYHKKGMLLAPRDALEGNSIILKLFQDKVNQVHHLKEKGCYTLGSLTIETPIKHDHDGETYGLHIKGSHLSLSLIADGRYFKGLESYYPGDILILNVVLKEKKDQIKHLSLEDAEHMIGINKPRLSILTHFGMNMIRAKPWELAERLTEKLGVKVTAARDGMSINLEEYW